MTSKVALLVLVCLVAVILADFAEGKKKRCDKCDRKTLKTYMKDKSDSCKKKWSKSTAKRSKKVKPVQSSFDKCYQTIDETCSKDSGDDSDLDALWEVTEKLQNYIENFSDNIKYWLEESRDDNTCRTNLKSIYDDGCAELQKYSSYSEVSQVVQTYTTTWTELYKECNEIITQ